jgi:hypothetical protein
MLLGAIKGMLRTGSIWVAVLSLGLSSGIAAETITFSKDVAPIFYRKCVACHHPNDLAPMSLMDYKSSRPWAKAIREAVISRKMPPWFADPHFSRFANDPSLTKAELETITAWVGNGAPEGKPADLPKPPVFETGWRIGKPDAVFDIGEDHKIGDNADEYTHFQVDTGFTEGHWVKAVELRPGNRRVVHHAHVSVRGGEPAKPKIAAKIGGKTFADYLYKTSDKLRHMRLDAPVVDNACAADIEQVPDVNRANEGSFTSYLPGMPPDVFPEGTAKWIPAGAKLAFSIHYHKNGTQPEMDRTSVGFVFADGPPAHPLHRMDVDNLYFRIPAGDGNHEVKQCATFNSDVKLLSFTPHMHYRGKDARFEIQRPGEAPETVLFVPRYDFNWQLAYRLQDPLAVPRGTRLIITVHYDNSVNNPSNPDPKKVIRWGEPSEEEMMSGWINYVTVGNSQVASSRE